MRGTPPDAGYAAGCGIRRRMVTDAGYSGIVADGGYSGTIVGAEYSGTMADAEYFGTMADRGYSATVEDAEYSRTMYLSIQEMLRYYCLSIQEMP